MPQETDRRKGIDHLRALRRNSDSNNVMLFSARKTNSLTDS
jgi:hypothetical protein